MYVSCVSTDRELAGVPADVIVFPERVSLWKMEAAQRCRPHSFIAGAVVDDSYCRGVLFHRGENQIDYLKVGQDTITDGSRNLDQNPVFESGNVCIGMIICRDIQNVIFTQAVTDKIKKSQAKLKFLCVPAAMDSSWFNSESLMGLEKYEGMHVIVCNHTSAHEDRCKSFVTDTHGRKVCVQNDKEPLHVELGCSVTNATVWSPGQIPCATVLHSSFVKGSVGIT